MKEKIGFVPPTPRTITAAKGINSGGICLIFCQVGRNLLCHQPIPGSSQGPIAQAVGIG